jgi:DNA-binding transcriptional LysR family regulator
MQIEIRHIKAFLAVASELHFGRAAEKLNIAQPALSRTIKSLEEYLTVQLFERNTRTVRLTEAGKTFQEHGASVIHQLNQAVHLIRSASSEESGTISVGYVDQLLCGPVAEIMSRFRRRHDQIRIEFVPGSPDELCNLVADKQFDCGFVFGPVRDADLDSVCISVEPPVLVLPVTHRLSLKRKVHIRELAQESFILPPRYGWRNFHELFDQTCSAASFTPRKSQEVHQADALFAMVAAEMGVGICPESLLQSQRTGVVAKEISGSTLFFETSFVWNPETISGPLASLQEIVVEYIIDT